MICKVTWCNNETEFYNKTQRHSYCSTHYQYKQICGAASRKDRPHLMYKVEKVLANKLICEHCGLDMVKQYGEDNFKSIITAMDVDHINPSIKGTPEGEQPSNYQLLCKMCHIIKSHKEGDYKAKKYRKHL